SRRRHTRFSRDWSSDVCSSDLHLDNGYLTDVRTAAAGAVAARHLAREDARVAGVLEADVVVTATPAREPLVVADWLHPGLHVTRSEERRVGKEGRPRGAQAGSR